MVVVRKGLPRIRHGSIAVNYVIAPQNLDRSFGEASNTLAKLSIETAFSSLSLSDNKVRPSTLVIST